MKITSANSRQEALVRLNREIGDTENRGGREWLAGILAPRLTIQLTDNEKTINNQVAFLQGIKMKRGQTQ